jgi:ABC-type transporter Mla subunit MlaD
MRRFLSTLGLLAALGAAFVLTGTQEEGPKGVEYKVEFDNAFGLVEGGDLQVGGVRAGKTKTFEVEKPKGKRPVAVVTIEISEPGFDDFREDASCAIKPQSLIGEYYVDCQTGSGAKLARDGSGRVPVQNNESTIPQDIVNDMLRRPYRERFGIILSSLGAGLAGRPEDIQEVLKRAHPGLRETSRVLRILGKQNRVIERFIVDSDTVMEELEANKRDVVRWVRESADTAEISASRREDIARSFERLPTFLAELRPTMRNLGDLADEQIPLLTDLERAAPHLDTFFTRLGPFSEASRPAIRSLGEAAQKGTRAFGEGAEEVAELRRLARDAAPTGKPLRQFLDTMDDRRRYIEIDPRAKNGAPPEPDPTAIPGEGGFTGAEAFWNYWLWQGLSINGFDRYSHILRIGLAFTPCAEYVNEGPQENPEHDEEFFEKCNSWLGPYQPGINAPDFSEDRVTRARAEKAPARAGERRGEGEPDAGPLPGQRDLSQPNITLPPGAQALVDELDQGGQNRGSGDQAAQMLDYLLAP